MKKASLFSILCCLLLLCALPALAEEQSLPVITITYAADAALSTDAAVDAQVTIARDGQEHAFPARLRLNAAAMDSVERELPQRSLYIEGADTRFVLYNDGGDALRTKVLGTAFSGLVAQGPVPVPVRAQEPVEVYINGDYCGLYSKREDIADAIARFEGLDSTDTLHVSDVNKKAFCGDTSGIFKALQQIKQLDLSLEADRQALNALLDTESYLNWLAANIFVGNANMYSDIIYYQVGEGPVKCAMGDFACAMLQASSASYASLNTVYLDFDYVLMIEKKLLSQPEYRDAFLAKLGALYQALPAQAMQEAVDAASAQIADALPRHMERWADAFIQAMGDSYPAANAQDALLYQRYCLYRLRDKTLVRRPWYLYDQTQSALEVSEADMLRYFGSEKPALIEVPSESWETYKAANQ